MEYMIQHIESEQPLAIVFNKVISKITTLWIMTRPRIFDDTKGEEAAFKMITYYQILLWEKWLHEVVQRLQEWTATIDEYFDEFNGCWEYYALSKRLDFLNEDLYPLINAIEANSRVSIIDILQKVSGKEVTAYTMGDDGHLRPVTFADRELHKVSEMVEAHDYGQIIIIVAMLMEQLTRSIETAAKSDTAFGDNHDLLRAIQSDAEAILSLKFEGTRYFKSSKTICYDKF